MCVCVCVSVCASVSECDRETSIIVRPWPTRDCCAMEKNGFEWKINCE